MVRQPDVEAARAYIAEALRDNPVGASTRFTLAEGLIDRFPLIERDDARSLVGRALAAMQDARQVVILRAESWDMSGDERVRLTAS